MLEHKFQLPYFCKSLVLNKGVQTLVYTVKNMLFVLFSHR